MFLKDFIFLRSDIKKLKKLKNIKNHQKMCLNHFLGFLEDFIFFVKRGVKHEKNEKR
jgi:hypothetical protein